jgi:branched-subunit amino acid ABC-type transport system permease component
MHVVQLLVNGILLGGVFALSALGFNIIFGVMRVAAQAQDNRHCRSAGVN